MSNIYIGCSGFSYNHWKTLFYPENLSKIKWLEYYSTYFNTVELNTTFYRMPKEKTVTNWYNRTPDNFIFSVKGSRLITHYKKLRNCEDELSNFFENILLLKEKLNIILWQLPPTFKVSLDILESFFKILKPYGIKNTVEFRNKTWLVKEVFDLCKFYNISLCIADWPQFLQTLSIQADFIYIRRHGKDGHYNTSYTYDELNELAAFIKSSQNLVKNIYVYFNNDFAAFAPKNALELKNILKGYIK